ncbi:MAG: tetratricopeptide repeat protein [Deltaproteobacteria bacterium]|nr:tetratricopeptide repeat protein [Deltaproteobacteria bacterium]
MLAHCKFPPPTTSDEQTQNPPVQQEYQISPQQVEQAKSEATIAKLQEELDQLRGKFEVLGYEVEQLRDLQKNTTRDIDSRLSVLESQQSITAKQPSTSEIARSVAVTSNESIDTWISNINQNISVAHSIDNILKWLDQTPQHPKRLSALFALAKGYFNQNDHPRAIQGFQTVVDDYPKSGEACDARYYQGRSFVKLGDSKNAKLFFQETIEICPTHSAKEKSEYELKLISG